LTDSPTSKPLSSSGPKTISELPALLHTASRLLAAEWAELSGKPSEAAEAALRFAQLELVVPLLDEARELRGQLYSGLAGQLVHMIREAEKMARHTCSDGGDPDTYTAQQTCGACLIARINAEVWIPPIVGR
jgi:hypothetical protein